MPSVDKLCSAFCAELSRGGQIKPDQLPANENLLVMLLEDPTIAAIAKKPDQHQQFYLAVKTLILKKFAIPVEPKFETVSGIYHYCLGVQRALDEIMELPKWSEDQLGVIRKLFLMDSRVIQTCSELFKELLGADDALPLLICALRLLKKNNEPLFNRVHSEISVILEQLQNLRLSSALTPVMDFKYTGGDVIDLLERRLIDFLSGFQKIIPNVKPLTWEIGKIPDFVETIYDFMIEVETTLRERDTLTAQQELNGLKELLIKKNANLDDEEVKSAIKEVRLCNPFLLYRLLADETVLLSHDFKSRLSGELQNTVDPEKLNGPENAHVRTARNILVALVNAINDKKTCFNSDCWKFILESFLRDREIAHYLQLELKKIQNPPAEVREIFGKVGLYHRIIPMLKKIFLDEKISPAKQLDEIRLMLIRDNVTEKRKLEYLIKVALYENSGITYAVSYFIPENWKSRPSTLALLSVVDINNFDHLNKLYNQLTERAHYVEAETRLQKQGVFGQLEMIGALITQACPTVNLEDMNKRIQEIIAALEQLKLAEHELEHAKYFSSVVVAEPMRQVAVYNLKLDELLQELICTSIEKLSLLFSGFENKHAQLEHAGFHEELVALRATYLAHQPNFEKLSAVNARKYQDVINTLDTQLVRFTDLEDNFQPSLSLFS